MRVLSGRLKAVLVASLATVILAGIAGPGVTLAGDPPGLARFMHAIGQVESGGDYQARNATSGAYGKYQIMPSNWGAWAGRYLDDRNAAPTPRNQELVAGGKFRSLHGGLGSWSRVAYWWLTGSSQRAGWSATARRYVERVMARYRNTTDEAAAVGPVPDQVPGQAPVSIERFPDRSRRISYAGTWQSAAHPRYTGHTVQYATGAGATATFVFTGSKVTWYGPVGPTRGQARIRIDGHAVRTVDLYARSFSPRNAIFTKRWSTAGQHTLVIEVVGTAGRPYVAIDELAVTN